jgi:hypothetical protein
VIHPDTELRFVHREIGFGVVATRLIPKGTITWVQDELDQVFPPSRMEGLGAIYEATLHKYTFVNAKAEYILCWDLARFVNHSCNPSCLSAGYNFEVAVRDIHPGEELTDDYATLNLEGSFACHCGSRQCRGTVREEDVFARAEQWDAIIGEAFPLIGTTPQPLWPLVAEKDAVQAALSGKSAIASCKLNLRAYRQNATSV